MGAICVMLTSIRHNAPPYPSSRLPAYIATAAMLCAGSVAAQNSPYFVGVAQALAHESNLLRLKDGQGPAAGQKKADTVATTSLVGGFDQPIGRQRLYGNATLRSNNYADNSEFNNQGYGLSLGADWSTVNRISGKLDLASQRNFRQFDPAESDATTPASRRKNIESAKQVNAVGRIGTVTRLTAEAGLSWRKVDYSDISYSRAEYDQTGASLGLFYRLGGFTNVGLRLRNARTDYFNSPGDKRSRNDVDLIGDWTPSALTKLSGRLSYGKEDAKLASVADFSGFSGELQANWQATGKTNLSMRLVHDTGQEAASQNIGGTTLFANDFSRTTTGLSLGANYAFSSKINFTAGLSTSRRDLKNSQFGLIVGSPVSADGSDTTTVLSLGARWQPTRVFSLGCDIRQEKRSANSSFSSSYSNNGLSCFGQLVLQGV